jgi:hypothetical protein
MLVCSEEERTVVWEGRRELHHLGVAFAEIHDGRIGRTEVRPPHGPASMALTSAEVGTP